MAGRSSFSPGPERSMQFRIASGDIFNSEGAHTMSRILRLQTLQADPWHSDGNVPDSNESYTHCSTQSNNC
jgi:hypothetical protein